MVKPTAQGVRIQVHHLHQLVVGQPAPGAAGGGGRVGQEKAFTYYTHILINNTSSSSFKATHGPTNPFNAWQQPAHGDYALNQAGMALRHRQYLPSDLGGFGTENKPFQLLGAVDKENEILLAMRTHGFTKVGGAAGLGQGIVESAEVNNLAFFGLHDPEKPNQLWRSVTKPVSLVSVPETGQMLGPAPFAWVDYPGRLAPKVPRLGALEEPKKCVKPGPTPVPDPCCTFCDRCRFRAGNQQQLARAAAVTAASRWAGLDEWIRVRG